MNILFDEPSNFASVLNCNDVNPSGIRRFDRSPFFEIFLRYNDEFVADGRSLGYDVNINKSFKGFDSFVYPTGVTHAPWDWCGWTDLGTKYSRNMDDRVSVLGCLPKKVLKKLQDNQAYLLLDQTHEGYHVSWLYDWFHDMCNQYNVSPSRIIYMTGDLDSACKYDKWCEGKDISEKLYIIGHPHFEVMIHWTEENRTKIYNKLGVPNVSKHLMHKKNNLVRIKTYNALQKRPRAHRIWLFYYLHQKGLLEHGIVSMNKFRFEDSWFYDRELTMEECKTLDELLPIFPRKDLTKQQKKDFIDEPGTPYQEDLNDFEALNSWITVVSEAQYSESTCFISEKTFKPIATHHPFIVCGDQNSLHYMRELGYETFGDFIDESYDKLTGLDRIEAISDVLSDLRSKRPRGMYSWYKAQRPILEHNANHLKAATRNRIIKVAEDINSYISDKG